MIILEILTAFLVITGSILIAIPRIEALYFFALAQISSVIWCIMGEYWFFLAQSCFLFLMNIIAYKNWDKKGIG